MADDVQPDMTPLNPSRDAWTDEKGTLHITVPNDPNKAKDPLNATVAKPQDGGWDKVPVVGKVPPPPMSGSTHDTIATNGSYSGVLNAFGQGFMHEWGSAQFGPELKQTLTEHGVLYDGKGDITVPQAFNEAFVRPAANALDVGLRALTGVGQGIHDASIEAGHPFDSIAAVMEAFPTGGVELGRLGWTPGTLEKPRFTGGTGGAPDLRVAKDLNVIGPEKPALSAGDAATAAKNIIQPITAYHGSPYSFDAFSMDKIGTGEGAQSYGHGLYFAEHPEVANSYAVGRQTGTSSKIGTPGSPFANVEAMDVTPPNKYQVRIHVNKDDMLDWDKPLSEQPAGKKLLAHMDTKLRNTLEDMIEDRGGGGDLSDYTGLQVHRLLEELASDNALPSGIADERFHKSDVSKYLHDAGIPGIKYLDQNSRLAREDVPTLKGSIAASERKIAEIQKEMDDNKNNPSLLPQFFKRRTEDIAELNRFIKAQQDTLRMKDDGGDATHNFVLFSDKDVEITHKNGDVVSRPVPAVVNDTDLVKRSEPGQLSPVDQNPWQERFDQWVTKLQVPDDVKNLIRNAAAQNGQFTEARAGQIPAEHLGKLSDITGIPVEQMPESKMRMTMRNDDEFRVAAQLMIKTNDDVFEAARNHKTEGTFETRKELVAAIMRRDLALEGVLGLRAEWGRTGNVMQEFLDSIKDAQGLGKFIKDKKGDTWDTGKLDEVANKLGSMNSREAIGKYLTDLRKPDFMDKAIWYWTNSILSGPITHAKYIFANAAYLAHDTLIATPLAGVTGAVRQAFSKEEIERVYMGEAAAKVYGMVAGVPDALYAAGQAVKTGVPTALEAQVKGTSTENPITQLKQNPFTSAVGKPIGEVIGVPSRMIAGIHSFFNFLGYRSELEALGYRQAVKDGHSPLTAEFWKTQKAHAEFPDDPMMDKAIEAGSRANFVQDLGPSGKAMQSFLYKTRLGRFVMPFTRVPGNIFNAVQEGTPFAFLDSRMRDNLLGRNGGAARDMAIGRLTAGSAVMGWAGYMTLQDKITGNGPIDPKQRAEWMLTHQPRSIQIGGKWVSYDRFGPVGGWLSLAADLTDSQQALQRAQNNPAITETQRKQYDRDMTEAYSRVVVGFTHWVEEAGYQGLFDMVEAMNDPGRTRAANVGAIAQTALPFSSLQSQSASFMDPTMRDTQTFLDGIKNRTPVERETLPVVRDWSGAPRPNPAYHSLVRIQAVNDDPVDREMQRLDLKPTKPADSIRGVKLSREQYDEYQTLAGTNTREALHALVERPGWAQVPDFAKGQIIERSIKASRAQAEAFMQMKYPSLINEGVDNRMTDILGNKHKPTAYQRP